MLNNWVRTSPVGHGTTLGAPIGADDVGIALTELTDKAALLKKGHDNGQCGVKIEITTPEFKGFCETKATMSSTSSPSIRNAAGR